jgi:hypothetical protein
MIPLSSNTCNRRLIWGRKIRDESYTTLSALNLSPSDAVDPVFMDIRTAVDAARTELSEKWPKASVTSWGNPVGGMNRDWIEWVMLMTLTSCPDRAIVIYR